MQPGAEPMPGTAAAPQPAAPGWPTNAPALGPRPAAAPSAPSSNAPAFGLRPAADPSAPSSNAPAFGLRPAADPSAPSSNAPAFGSLHPEHGADGVAAAARDAQLGAVAQHHGGIARRQRLQLTDAIHPHDGRAVDAQETIGVQHTLHH